MRVREDSRLDEFDVLVPERTVAESLAPGVLFKRFPRYFVGESGSDNMVNVYSVEVSRGCQGGFGLEFSAQGDYCASLAAQAQRTVPGRLLFAATCNFGLIVDEYDRRPMDASFNLHVENHRLIQLPVADKTALLIDTDDRLAIGLQDARGSLRIGEQAFAWVGSLSKSRAHPGAPEDRIIVYNSFNRRILVSRDAVTGSKRGFEPASTYTPSEPSRVDVLIESARGGPIVSAINEATRSHVFSAHMIFSMPRQLARAIRVGDRVTDVTLGEIALGQVKYGATIGAVLTRDCDETDRNIRRSAVVQTLSAETGEAVYHRGSKFARACVVITPRMVSFVLVDARRAVDGQEGMTIGELRKFLNEAYPDYKQAASLDGGHAAKLAIPRETGIDVYGNCHYRVWPRTAAEPFRWNGYLGARVPAVMYLSG